MDWCLKKAEKEFAEKGKHRGLKKISSDLVMARKHIKKSEHYLDATLYLKEKFSDVSASTIFYSAYHSLLALLSKFGYESRNQECTFALIYNLIEGKKISLDKKLIDKIFSIGSEDGIIDVREKYQYGVSLSMVEELFNENFDTVKELLGKVKEEIENEN